MIPKSETVAAYDKKRFLFQSDIIVKHGGSMQIRKAATLFSVKKTLLFTQKKLVIV